MTQGMFTNEENWKLLNLDPDHPDVQAMFEDCCERPKKMFDQCMITNRNKGTRQQSIACARWAKWHGECLQDKEKHFRTAQAGYLKNNLKQEVGFMAKGGVVGVEYWRTYGTPQVDIRDKDIQRGK